MRLVLVPANSDAGFIFGKENLLDARGRATECFDPRDERRNPGGDLLGRAELSRRVVVPEAERRNPPLALVLTKLKRLKRQHRDVSDQRSFAGGRDELAMI